MPPRLLEDVVAHVAAPLTQTASVTSDLSIVLWTVSMLMPGCFALVLSSALGPWGPDGTRPLTHTGLSWVVCSALHVTEDDNNAVKSTQVRETACRATNI